MLLRKLTEKAVLAGAGMWQEPVYKLVVQWGTVLKEWSKKWNRCCCWEVGKHQSVSLTKCHQLLLANGCKPVWGSSSCPVLKTVILQLQDSQWLPNRQGKNRQNVIQTYKSPSGVFLNLHVFVYFLNLHVFVYSRCGGMGDGCGGQMFSPCTMWVPGIKLSHQAWQQALEPAEPCNASSTLVFLT